MVAQCGDKELGGEWLGRVPGGAEILAASALGAGCRIQQALPGDVGDRFDSEPLIPFHLLNHVEPQWLTVDKKIG